jgi:hypothetical protein
MISSDDFVRRRDVQHYILITLISKTTSALVYIALSIVYTDTQVHWTIGVLYIIGIFKFTFFQLDSVLSFSSPL